MAADAILELFIENKILNKKNSDLQARAESAEARCNMLEKMVKEYQEVIVPGYIERGKGRAGPFTNEGGMSCEQERNPF